MERLTAKTRSSTSVHYKDVDFELEYTPIDQQGILVTETETGLKLGYLIQDECPPNPLEDSEGYGVIHHHPRSSYGRRDSEYYSILGLDSYGDPIVDEDKLQDLWTSKVKSLPLYLFTLPEEEALEGHQETLREELAKEWAGDYTVNQQCGYAWSKHTLTDETRDTLIANMEENLLWNYEDIKRECQVSSNQDVIMLDLYDHSGCHWSIAGTGMNCRWDTSKHEALWIPDEALLDEISSMFPEDRAEHLLKTCKAAIEMYNAWSNGGIYEVFIQHHDMEGWPLHSDYGGTYYGLYEAERGLEEEMKCSTAK